MSRTTFASILPAILVLTLWAVGVYGWVMNIVQLVAIADSTITGMFILKAIGIIVAPLGAVLGLIG